MTTITCKLFEELAAQLEALARAKRRSKSDLVREALVERLNREHVRAEATAYDLVKHLCGCLKDGPADLATNPLVAFCTNRIPRTFVGS